MSSSESSEEVICDPVQMQDILYDVPSSDALLVAEGQTFPVHRTYLSEINPFFKVTFYENKDKFEVPLSDISGETLKLVIQHLYGIEVTVTKENVHPLCVSADRFSIVDLLKTCNAFISSSLDGNNVISNLNWSREVGNTEVESRAMSYILVKFPYIFKECTEYQLLSVDDLHVLLVSDRLNIKREEDAFLAVMRWVAFEPEDRKPHISRLLACIRFGFFNAHFFIEHVIGHSYVREDPAALELMTHVREAMERWEPGWIVRPRIPNELLFVVGGWSDAQPIPLVEVYDQRTQRWIIHDGWKINPIAYNGLVVLDQVLYMIGGFNGMEYFSKVSLFDPYMMEAFQGPAMHEKRCYVSVAVLDDCIYAMGGYNGQSRLSSVECYTKRNNQWNMVASMNERRSDACATALYGDIYICGGFNGRACLSTCEKYDPEMDQWTIVTTMSTARSGTNCVSLDGRIYVVGGFNGENRLSSVESYDPKANSWRNLANMNLTRSNFAIRVLEGDIYAVGGYDGNRTTNRAERYCPQYDVWYPVTMSHVCRSACSACVLSELPNDTDIIGRQRDYT